MNDKIFKAVDSITKEEVLEACCFADVPDYGDVMTYEEFMEDVECGGIIDYDGEGAFVFKDKIATNTGTNVYDKTMYFVDKLFVQFDVLHNLFGDDMKICWFNR